MAIPAAPWPRAVALEAIEAKAGESPLEQNTDVVPHNVGRKQACIEAMYWGPPSRRRPYYLTPGASLLVLTPSALGQP
jgi:hypothetical protein